jgi:hypothetical protein
VTSISQPTSIRQQFLEAAASAVSLLSADAVASSWSNASALDGFTVGGLAGHLASQLLYPADALTKPQPAGEPIPVTAHYERASWVGADLDGAANVAIRAVGESVASAGPAEVAASAAAALAALRSAVDDAPADRTVSPPSGSWTLSLDDHLLTRIMEIAVHSDDLAVSVGLPTPELPPAVIEPVIDLLTRIALRRRGQVAVLRALSRSERAPETISAF